MVKNPFSLGSSDIPLCNRQNEMSSLIRHAENNQNALLYGSRRLGKTMLVKEVQTHLRAKEVITLFADFFGVVSIEDIAARTCRALFEVVHQKEPLFKKTMRALTTFRPSFKPTADGLGLSFSVEQTCSDIGIEVLERTMFDLKQLMQNLDFKLNIVFDEFQEITEVEKGVQIQGVLRKYIQDMQASFFFVGSKKRILKQIFQDKSKPFFQSTFDYELKALPENEATDYIIERFQYGNRKIGFPEASLIYSLIAGNPYYLQKYCHLLFEEEKSVIDETTIYHLFGKLLDLEKDYFESIINQLTAKQINLLTALAKEETRNLYAKDFIKRHSLGSIGGVQQNIDSLSKEDLVAKEEKGWLIVDPVFKVWLTKRAVF